MTLVTTLTTDGSVDALSAALTNLVAGNTHSIAVLVNGFQSGDSSISVKLYAKLDITDSDTDVDTLIVTATLTTPTRDPNARLATFALTTAQTTRLLTGRVYYVNVTLTRSAVVYTRTVMTGFIGAAYPGTAAVAPSDEATLRLAGDAALRSLYDSKLASLTGTTNRITVGGTATAPMVDIASTYDGQSSITTLGTITTGTWHGSAIADTYLATISAAGKVANSATTAASTNTPSAIVARDASGNFSAGTITATLNGAAPAGSLSGTTLAANVVTSSLTALGTIATGVWQGTQIVDTYLATISTAGKVANAATTATSANTASAIVARDGSGNFAAGTITATSFVGALTGNASTATTLATARSINGISFDGGADITVPAAAGSLLGATLNATVVNSSLQTFGIMQAPHMVAPVVDSGGLTVTTGTSTFGGAVDFSQNSRTLDMGATAGSGAIADGYLVQMTTSGKSLTIATTSTSLDKVVLAYRDTSGAGAWRSAIDFAAANGFATVNILSAGGTLAIGASAVTMAGTLSATTVTAALSGNASTATALQTARAINGVSFDGTAAITVTAAAGTLTGTTLNASVVTSSLTSVGTLTSLTVGGNLAVNAGGQISSSGFNVASGTYALDLIATAGADRSLARITASGINGFIATYKTATTNIEYTFGDVKFVKFSGGDVVTQVGALATNATAGFLYVPTCAGTPSGVPNAYNGTVALAYDTTNNKLYLYNGAWKATAALT